MSKLISRLLILLGIIAIFTATAIYLNRSEEPISMVERVVKKPTPSVTTNPTPTERPVPQSYIIPQEFQVFQSFNNCGPASLSMLLAYHNVNVSQDVLGQKLRPYQNPGGDNDDKSVTLPELAAEAEKYNLVAYHRPNGNITIAKKLIVNDIPFIVRTWLNPNEDIGHYRVVRGYDDTTQEIIQDDSYQGGDLRYSYNEFMAMWQPFNYEYLVLVSPEKEELVSAILGDNAEWNVAWQNALERAQQEEQNSLQNTYPIFNQSVAYYHLGEYQLSIQKYEEVVNQLPSRMLWYQIEPIKSYLELDQYEIVFNLTSNILNNQNRGFSELYILRGKAYEEQGEIELARQEYEQAIFYNQNLEIAQEALTKLDSVQE